MRRANRIFNVTKTKEGKIGTSVVSSWAATYGSDERYDGKILKKVEELRGRRKGTAERMARKGGGRARRTRGVMKSEEKRGNTEWRWNSRMKKSVWWRSRDNRGRERCPRHAWTATAAATNSSDLLNSANSCGIASSARRTRYVRECTVARLSVIFAFAERSV